jgi:hypothetical protein
MRHILNLWFWICFGAPYHRHEFYKVGSDSWACSFRHCNAWYGEDIGQ